MKPLLLGDRTSSAVLAPPSLASRFGAWARESLVARAIAIALGLILLAAIGGSALAGSAGAKTAPAATPPAASSLVPVTSPAEAPIDAGSVPITRPELLPEATAAHATAQARATPDDPVDLNTARVEDLRRLPGVGEKRAEAILALRASLPGGRFKQIEDLLKVKGVGRAMLKRIHPLVRL